MDVKRPFYASDAARAPIARLGAFVLLAVVGLASVGSYLFTTEAVDERPGVFFGCTSATSTSTLIITFRLSGPHDALIVASALSATNDELLRSPDEFSFTPGARTVLSALVVTSVYTISRNFLSSSARCARTRGFADDDLEDEYVQSGRARTNEASRTSTARSAVDRVKVEHCEE
ncbi:hypothetical protein EXIGLDRAFT_766267 [Exidia glandulosa HHB12029]|uniref:Uncharacterized protein n=1 Tax=Exidia glandulosa HHB12029 TaxID=1314781 RepID=A0A165JUL7_EXIGL|nr:hypothetical protein EXIGLDRAFT_766267 [Exidia glandulosa HHB12029]